MLPQTPIARRLFRLKLIAVVALIAIAPSIGVRGAGRRAHLSIDLLQHEAKNSAARVNVIVSGSRDDVERLADAHGVAIVKWLRNGAVVRANSLELTDLAGDVGLLELSGDPLVKPGLAISNQTMAADQTRNGTSGLLGIGAIAGVTGKDIGVAVVDSGITSHQAVKYKIAASVSFVPNDPSVDDAYGHGTHVAGIIAGSASSITGQYTSGIAPGVQLINVRVLGADGTGYTSDVIRGIDWAVDNRKRYNIRVINLSLGHAVTDYAAHDPLCLAVERAVASGIVVVVAAGNDGRAENFARRLGGITSPGNTTGALTVGAITTWGTVNRADDTVADYSSRGPTKYDFNVKPDLAAPGSAIISLEAAGAYLPKKYPVLHRAGYGNNAYMQLSGTSMSAPMISGAVALLLQAAPSLTPAQIKLALQSGATFMKDGGLTGAGAGSANVWASRKIVANGLPSVLNSLTTIVGGLLAPSNGVSFWDDGRLSHRLYGRTGIRLLSILDLSKVWANPALLRVGDLNLAGLSNPLALTRPGPMLYGDLVKGMGDDDEITWGTTIHDSNGQEVVWGSSDDGDEITWGTSDTLTDTDPK
jgi:serine protease AprX